MRCSMKYVWSVARQYFCMRIFFRTYIHYTGSLFDWFSPRRKCQKKIIVWKLLLKFSTFQAAMHWHPKPKHAHLFSTKNYMNILWPYLFNNTRYNCVCALITPTMQYAYEALNLLLYPVLNLKLKYYFKF